MARASALGSGDGEVTSVIWRACGGLWSNCSADGASESGQPPPDAIVWSVCDAGVAIAAEAACSIGQKALSPLQTKNVVATMTGTTPSDWLADTLIPTYAINRPVTVQSRSGGGFIQSTDLYQSDTPCCRRGSRCCACRCRQSPLPQDPLQDLRWGCPGYR